MTKKTGLAAKRARPRKRPSPMAEFRRAVRASTAAGKERAVAGGTGARLAPISVVIPAHNYGRFLPQLLTSLSRQGRKPAEIIVVDNGSSDGTGALLQRLWRTSPVPLRMIIQKTPIGRPRARNEGIAAAKSERVFLIDADDWAAPDALERLGAALDENPKAAFAYGFAQLEGDRSGVLRYPKYNLKELLVHNYIPSCVLLRKSAWAATGGFDPSFETGAEDYDFWLTLAGRGMGGVQVPGVVFHYRFHGGNWSGQDRRHLLANGFALRKKHAALYSRHPMGAIGFEVAQLVRRVKP